MGGFLRGGRGEGSSRGRGVTPSQVYSLPGGAPVSQPDNRVTKVENALSTTYNDPTILGKLTLDNKFPNRPGYGVKGDPVVLWANYVEMLPSSSLVLNRYAINVAPVATGRKLEQIIRLFLEDLDLVKLSFKPVTDFRGILLSQHVIDFDEKEWQVPYRNEGEDKPSERATNYTVSLSFTGSLRVSELLRFLTSTDPNLVYDNKLQILQAFNIFLRNYVKSEKNLVAIGASKSFALTKNTPVFNLGAALQAVRGFFSSVRLGACRILVNVNVSHGAFYKQVGLDDLMAEYISVNGHSMAKLEAFLKKVKVESIHL